MIKECYYLNIKKRNFYKNYQINRNIMYAVPNDYVLFITPKANDSKGIIDERKYIDSFKNDHIKNIYWEDLIKVTMEIVYECAELNEYYDDFFDKYIALL